MSQTMSETRNPSLHLLNKAPSHPRFRSCLDAMAPGDQLLLLENAVIALADETLVLPPGTMALAQDCEARGLSDKVAASLLVDMPGMLKLTDRFPNIISW